MAQEQNKKLGLAALACVVVSSMVGGGIYSLPQNMAAGASAGAVLLAWLVTGVGMYFLANSFRILSDARSDLTAGVYMYARAGFGAFAGFTIGWGYWLCQIFGNVGYAVITMDALNYFFPPYFAGGNGIYSIIGGSLLIWVFNCIVLRGVKRASVVNIIGTACNIVPLLVFILIMAFVFKASTFDVDFWGNMASHGKSLGSVPDQIKSTMLVTLWAFIGIEGAVVLSDRARNKADVGKATFIGFLGCLAIYVLLSVLPYGFMNHAELAAVPNPSTAGVLEAAVGKWGSRLMNGGLLIAVLSSWLAWTMITAEIPFAAEKRNVPARLCPRKRQRRAQCFPMGRQFADAGGDFHGVLFKRRVEHHAVDYGRDGSARLFGQHGLFVENVRRRRISANRRFSAFRSVAVVNVRVALRRVADLRGGTAVFADGGAVPCARRPRLCVGKTRKRPERTRL